MSKILVTGAAGFIGFHLANSLLKRGDEVVGIDNLNDYYDQQLKRDRLQQLENFTEFSFMSCDIEDKQHLETIFKDNHFDVVAHLAAQAGVRHSINNPHIYIQSNVVGFLNILEGCRNYDVAHLVYASSSSVYGANTSIPFSVHDSVDHPISLYAATKKANELMAHTYSSLYGLPTTGLRFFTVYGPWGRPDMAYFSFAKAILEGRTIDVYNDGLMRRDFTYIDDIVECLKRVVDKPPLANPAWNRNNPDPGSSFAPYRIYNIGNNKPVELLYFVELLEDRLGKKAVKNLLPLQPGDVLETYADVADLIADFDFSPTIPIEEGIKHFVEWYRHYYKC